jgi:hypothetical protein
MSSLLDRVQSELNAARKAQDKPLLLLLGTILSDIKNREIELKRAVTDDDASRSSGAGSSVGVSRSRCTAGARSTWPEKESAEVAMLERYLPPQVDPEEIRAAVRAAMAGGAANVGAIMGKVMPAFKGRAEGGQISAIAREELAVRG